MSYLVYIKQALANLFKPPVTSKYPLEPKTFCAGERGRVVNDISQCILCGMCERSCPAGAITVDRKTGTWKINPFSCIQCGACVEACPKKCLSMDPHYAAPALKKAEIILQTIQKEGKAEVHKEVAAIQTSAASLAMDDRSHIVNNVMKCIFCGMCERNCPAEAITVDRRNRTWRINLEACVNCGTCIDNCPRKCLSLGCYLGNRTEVTVHGKMPMRKAAPKPVAPAAPAVAVPMPESVTTVDVPDSHIRNEIEKCLFCGKCEHACPVEAISIDRKNRTWTIDREKCVTCGVCASECPVHCLTLADGWEEGEKKEIRTTYQGKVLTRRPRVRPAPPKAAEPPKPAEQTKSVVPTPTVEAAPVAEGPQSDNPWHVKNEIEKCLFCGKCEHTCPVDAISIDRKNRTWTIDRDKCVTCGACTDGCPKKCLTLAEEWEIGENRAIHLILQGKAPQRPARPATPATKESARAAVSAPTVEAAPVAEGPQSDNPWHVRNEIEKCLFCGKCEHTCPVEAIIIDRKNRTWTIDRDKCVTCGVCTESCPKKCLTLAEEWEIGENRAIHLTLQGKAPQCPARPATPATKEPAKAAVPVPTVAAAPVAEGPQSDNPWHVKNEIEKCLFCGKCEHTCPVEAISIDRNNRTWTIDRDKCVACGACTEGCPKKCLTLAEEWEIGENRAIHLTLQGKAPQRPARPATPATKEPAKAAASVPTVATAPVAEGPQSDNPWHVKNEIEKCLFCGKCEHTCPVDAISIDRKNRTWTIDRDKCVTCGVCTEGCPKKCLTLKEEWDADENRSIHLTLQGKAPQRLARTAPKVEPKVEPAPEPSKAEEKPAEAADVPQSENSFHVKNHIDKCLFCGKCLHNCPAEAISIDRKNRTWTIDREKCMVCGVCAEGCPTKCLSMEEEWQEGENRALVLTLQGKPPVRRPRLAGNGSPHA